ncbi:hypothetical protein EZV62_001867 [Acer yangbiense]|uniref:Uncharacterized protein n=1 Tax=Acer yangbiense TaxID=1000413 RepID=A0A5C7IW26_9ROSI|nr:hypothetical protein EZV62_001867 [Acer yangbiense]
MVKFLKTNKAVILLQGRDKEVPEQGYQEGLDEEDCEEVTREVVYQVSELPAPDADALHSGRGLEGSRDWRCSAEQGQEGHGRQGDQEEVRGEVQDWKESLVFYQAQVLIFFFFL